MRVGVFYSLLCTFNSLLLALKKGGVGAFYRDFVLVLTCSRSGFFNAFIPAASTPCLWWWPGGKGDSETAPRARRYPALRAG